MQGEFQKLWLNTYLQFLLLLHRALWNLHIVHSPTNALFIKLGKV